MSVYDKACRGWREGDEPSLLEQFPYAVWLGLAFPFLAVLIFLIGVAQHG